jgi:glycine/serine hydroxymethyltransferase
VALKQANTPEFKTYQQQVVANCQALAQRMQKLGYTIVSGEACVSVDRESSSSQCVHVGRGVLSTYSLAHAGCQTNWVVWHEPMSWWWSAIGLVVANSLGVRVQKLAASGG